MSLAGAQEQDTTSPAPRKSEITAHSIEAQYGDRAFTDLGLDKLRETRILTEDIFNVHPYQLMRVSLKQHLPSATNTRASAVDWLHLGHQQFYFRPSLLSTQLLPDGTDTRFLPGPPSIWKYRLWAGGSATYNLKQPFNLAENLKACQLELIQDIRVIGEDKPEKVFVTVRRIIVEQNRLLRSFTKQKLIQCLSQLERPPLEERYTLCFLRDPPGDPIDRKGISPPTDALHSHQMIPDPNLLFQFSALTYNAHKIHFSSSFAQEEYGMKHVVVHGPFTQLLLTEFLRRSVMTYSNVPPHKNVYIKSVQYTNLKPLYADEPMTLCCKPRNLAANQEPWQAESWRVWIQTGQGKNAALAVKSVIEVGLASRKSSTSQGLYQVDEAQGRIPRSRIASRDFGDNSSGSYPARLRRVWR